MVWVDEGLFSGCGALHDTGSGCGMPDRVGEETVGVHAEWTGVTAAFGEPEFLSACALGAWEAEGYASEGGIQSTAISGESPFPV